MWGTLLFLLNISPLNYKNIIFYFAHRKFRSKQQCVRTGGEISFPVCSKIDPKNIAESLNALCLYSLIITSKLHPGVISLSFGNDAWFINPTSKIKNCMEDAGLNNLVQIVHSSKRLIKVNPKICKDLECQRKLINSCIDFLQKSLWYNCNLCNAFIFSNEIKHFQNIYLPKYLFSKIHLLVNCHIKIFRRLLGAYYHKLFFLA